MTDEFIDHHLPFFIQFLISKTLHGFQSSPNRKKLMELEHELFSQFNQNY